MLYQALLSGSSLMPAVNPGLPDNLIRKVLLCRYHSSLHFLLNGMQLLPADKNPAQMHRLIILSQDLLQMYLHRK